MPIVTVINVLCVCVYHHHHHHIVPLARISLTLSHPGGALLHVRLVGSFACLWMPFKRCLWADGTFTLNKFECSNQADVA